MTDAADAAPARTIPARLWDAPTRILHWALVALIAFDWWAAHAHHMDWHRIGGYGVLALLLFRLSWGFVGSASARFASFVRGPRATLLYVRALPGRAHHEVPGHNPLGAWSVLAILATLSLQVGTGLFAVDVDGIESGPLSDRVSFDTGRLLAAIHHKSFTVLEVLIVLHLLAILFYASVRRVNLVRPMISGRARFAVDPSLRFAPWPRAVLVALAAVLATLWIAKGMPT